MVSELIFLWLISVVLHQFENPKKVLFKSFHASVYERQKHCQQKVQHNERACPEEFREETIACELWTFDFPHAFINLFFHSQGLLDLC